MRVKVLQLHKRSSYHYRYIQDKYAFDFDNLNFAISDGTTQSFNSEFWAEILVNDFVKKPSFDLNELIFSFKHSLSRYKNLSFAYSKNPAIASIELEKQKKGATATFLGIRIENQHIKLVGCGDSNLFVFKDKDVRCSPFADISEMEKNTKFINTTELISDKVDEAFFQVDDIILESESIIILATDAISRLIFRKPEIISELIKITSFEMLNAFCLKYWELKLLQEDDITVLLIDLDAGDEVLEIIPGPNFEFPKEEEIIFIPPSPQSNPFSTMQMQEINNQFNGVANDMHAVKNKLQAIMIVATACLLVICFQFLFIWYWNLKDETKRPTEKITRSTSERIRSLELQLKQAGDKNKKYADKETTILKETAYQNLKEADTAVKR